MNWDFILKVMQCFGFNDIISGWIYKIFLLHQKSASQLMFHPGLTSLALEAFNNGNLYLHSSNFIVQRHSCMNHFLYAYNLLNLNYAYLSNLQVLFNAFQFYGHLSVQLVNLDKSCIYSSNSVPSTNISLHKIQLGCILGCLFFYFGVTLFQGARRK